jgi:hypothetical protein
LNVDCLGAGFLKCHYLLLLVAAIGWWNHLLSLCLHKGGFVEVLV